MAASGRPLSAIRVRPPGDKSVTHRALVLGALAEGESRLERPLTSLDARSMAGALRALGTEISPLREGATVTLRGRGLRGLRAPRRSLHCGNSGTTARFLLGVLAGSPLTARLTGDASLRTRPMRRVTVPLSMMGARFDELSGDGLPLIVHGGPLQPLTYDLPVAAAQVKSALLLAGLVGGVPVRLTEPARSRDHTERMLTALGVPLERNGRDLALAPTDRIPAFQTRIPGDLSSAAFLVGAALLRSDGDVVLEEVGINPTRAGALRVLERMGADVTVAARGEALGEPVGDVLIRPSALAACEVSPEEVPSMIDEIPILAVLASRARGRSVFHGVAELRVKESNRLELIARNLRAVGVTAEASGDTLWVEGTDRPPAGRVETARDHRLAMAFAVLGAVRGARVELSEMASVAVSYPTFVDDLRRVTGAA
ncbi:MAG TPA: 3-phosphoshikimate 1-carboxyvinyltransferase [Gemmatimonadales bacterium]|jgi:3-phosphoshikimate 1-carboxyvinyltransferase|nr:3-phosphoshikimate 1-carboxyvinyltransferase [Gemmatimonadales bacterium]